MPPLQEHKPTLPVAFALTRADAVGSPPLNGAEGWRVASFERRRAASAINACASKSLLGPQQLLAWQDARGGHGLHIRCSGTACMYPDMLQDLLLAGQGHVRAGLRTDKNGWWLLRLPELQELPACVEAAHTQVSGAQRGQLG